MDASKPFSIPARLIILDVIGTLLLATGLLKVLADVEFLPRYMLFDGYGFAFIVSGTLLMIPLIAHIVVHAGNRARSRSDNGRID